MRIKILGTGGAINNGLPYNSFIINEDFLIETPPDIMKSLFREKINREKINSIYISHFHADHCFGIPFLLLMNFNDGYSTTVTMTGPEGIGKRIKDICTLAFGADHPMQKWIMDFIVFKEIENGKEITTGGKYKFIPIRLFHSPETFGFTLVCEDKKTVYIADTCWDDSLLEYIRDADTVLIDLNGEKDNNRVHVSEYDLIENALPHMEKASAKFYGTHLKEDRISQNERIGYLKPGDEIEI